MADGVKPGLGDGFKVGGSGVGECQVTNLFPEVGQFPNGERAISCRYAAAKLLAPSLYQRIIYFRGRASVKVLSHLRKIGLPILAASPVRGMVGIYIPITG